MNKSLAYRSEIDGLRAIAVVCVILFHAGLEKLKGGYLGVDIFFVISGYLITKVINSDLQNHNFNFLNFYKRRIGRIVPALLLVIAITYLASWFLYLPAQHKIVGHYALASLLSISNILLHIKSQDYFGLENSGNPLFHTWSLGIEEQFYAIVPILIVLGHKLKIGVNGISLIIFTMSIVIYLATIHVTTFNFYMMPARAWELTIGMMAATFNNPFKNKKLFIWVGTLLILVPLIFAKKNSDLIFLFMLAITIGTGLLLINCDQNSFLGKILIVKPFTILGKMSYSLYLWHVPIYVFITYLIGKSLFSYATYAVLLALTSIISYKFIELPFRNGRNFKSFAMVGIITSVVIMAMAIVGQINEGHPHRSDMFSNLKTNNGFGIQCNGNSKISSDCSTSTKPQIAILGNSYAMVYAKTIHEQSGLNIVQLTIDSCAIGYLDSIKQNLKQDCAKFYKESVKTILDNTSIETVIISSPFIQETSIKEFEMSFVKLLTDLSNKKVVILGPTPTAPFHVGACIYKSSLINSASDCSFKPNNEHLNQIDSLNHTLKNNRNIIFFDITKIICPDDLCAMKVGKNNAIYLDHGHLTHTGAANVIRQLGLFDQ